MNAELLTFLEDLLGKGTPKSKGNFAFYCPFCHHRKQKLEIHLDNHMWECWTCTHKGRSIRSLLKQMNAAKHFFLTLDNILPNEKKYAYENPTNETKVSKLPDEYKPLWDDTSNGFYKQMCLKYLESRGTAMADILKYRIGYCSDGPYDGMIIFPNFDKTGKLNYFTTRTYVRGKSQKFKNPDVGRNVVGFELQLNWRQPIILMESALDAITARRNASPLYGTQLNKSVKHAIIENEVQDLYMCLDPDAFLKAMVHIEYFMNVGVNVYNVKLPKDTDANKLGFHEIWKRIKAAQIMTDDRLFKYKIKMGLL